MKSLYLSFSILHQNKRKPLKIVVTATDVLQPNKFFEILNQHFEEEAW